MSASENQPGMIPGRAFATQRFADAMLRSLGATQVTLRFAGPASGDTGSQLGIEAPSAGDLQISPALVKPLPPAEDGQRRWEVVLSATSLKVAVKEYCVDDVANWLLTAEGLVHQDSLLRIVEVTVDQILGVDCLYHLTATE